jgi:hypothetical protein
VNEPWWKALLREQQGSGFADLAGAEAAVTLPISDTLLTAIVQQQLPSSLPISYLELAAQADSAFGVRVKLKSPAFLPAFTIRFVVTKQPAIPDWPYLRLELAAQGMSTLFRTLVRAFASLPRWLHVDQTGAITVDLRLLAAEQGLGDYFRYLAQLEITTRPGRFVVSGRAILSRPS